MKQILLELDEDTASKLERVAPARSRKRSEFLREAVRKALWELEERATAEAYARQPDSAEPSYVDPRAWDSAVPTPRRRSKKR